jgi:hypothetical protein
LADTQDNNFTFASGESFVIDGEVGDLIEKKVNN